MRLNCREVLSMEQEEDWVPGSLHTLSVEVPALHIIPVRVPLPQVSQKSAHTASSSSWWQIYLCQTVQKPHLWLSKGQACWAPRPAWGQGGMRTLSAQPMTLMILLANASAHC